MRTLDEGHPLAGAIRMAFIRFCTVEVDVERPFPTTALMMAWVSQHPDVATRALELCLDILDATNDEDKLVARTELNLICSPQDNMSIFHEVADGMEEDQGFLGMSRMLTACLAEYAKVNTVNL